MSAFDRPPPGKKAATRKLDSPTTKKLATPSRKGTQALSKKSLETPSAKTPAATQGASTLMLAGVGLAVLVLMGGAVLVVVAPSSKPVEVASNASTIIARSEAPAAPSVGATETALSAPRAANPSTQAARRQRVGDLISTADDRYGDRDFDGANGALGEARAAAATDEDLLREVNERQARVDAALKARAGTRAPVSRTASDDDDNYVETPGGGRIAVPDSVPSPGKGPDPLSPRKPAPAAPKNPEPGRPEPSRPEPAKTDDGMVASLAALQARLNVKPSMDASGKISLFYSFHTDAEAADFENVSCALCEKNPDSDRCFAEG